MRCAIAQEEDSDHDVRVERLLDARVQLEPLVRQAPSEASVHDVDSPAAERVRSLVQPPLQKLRKDGIAVRDALAHGERVSQQENPAVDRRIWAALGNTTNLAARLQSLTRELDASLVIDLATWRAAGEEAADMRRHEGLSLRGRTTREDVYLLPLTDPVAG
jgi:class 3 adenylate cyclase